MNIQSVKIGFLATLALVSVGCGTKDAPGPIEPTGATGRVRFVNLLTDPTRLPVERRSFDCDSDRGEPRLSWRITIRESSGGDLSDSRGSCRHCGSCPLNERGDQLHTTRDSGAVPFRRRTDNNRRRCGRGGRPSFPRVRY